MIIILKLARHFAHHHCYFLITTLALKMKSATISLGFQRILQGKAKVENASSINRLIVDSGRLYSLILVCNLFWTNPAKIFSLLTLFHSVVHRNFSETTSAVADKISYQIVIFVLAVIACSALSMLLLQGHLKPRAVKLADIRIQRTSEVLRHLSDYVSPNALYPLYLTVINSVRKSELRKVFLLNFVFAIISSLSWWAPSLAMHVTLRSLSANYLAHGPGKDDQNLLTTLMAFFSQLVGPLWIFPLLINKLVSCRVAVTRLCKLLISGDRRSSIGNDATIANDATIGNGIHIQVDKLKPIVLDGSFSRGQLITVDGGMGSGKTALLASLALDRSAPFSCRIKHFGRGWHFCSDNDDNDNDDENHSKPPTFVLPDPSLIGHCPPNGCLMIGSMKDNIVFDRKFDPSWYQEVLRVCALTPGMFAENISSSDHRAVMSAKHGLLCSGGQRERILLGRALYGRPRILLIDDNLLTSLDERIADYIFRSLLCPNSFLSSLTVVLVTDNKKYLGCANRMWTLVRTDSCNFLITEKDGLAEEFVYNDDVVFSDSGVLTVTQQPQSQTETQTEIQTKRPQEHTMNVFKLATNLVKESGGIFLYILAFSLLFACDLVNLEREKNLLSFFPATTTTGTTGDVAPAIAAATKHFSVEIDRHSSLIGLQALLTMSANSLIVLICYKLSYSIHSKFLSSLPRAIAEGQLGPDDCITKIGRDLEMVDYNYFDKLITLFGICSRISCLAIKFILENKLSVNAAGVAFAVVSVFLSLIIATSAILFALQCSFSPLWRCLIRLQSRLVSPLTCMLLQYSPSMTLLQSSRLYGTLSVVKRRFSVLLDRCMMTYLLATSTRRWILLRVDLISIAFYTASLTLIMITPILDNATKGIFISWITVIPDLVNLLFKQLADIDHIFIAMERLTCHNGVSLTASTTFNIATTIKDDRVALSFQNVSVTSGNSDGHNSDGYSSSGGDSKAQTKDQTTIKLPSDLTIMKGDQVCLMGRTGAGKSTVVQAIFDTSKIVDDGGSMHLPSTEAPIVAILQMDQIPSLEFVLGFTAGAAAGGAIMYRRPYSLRDVFSLNYCCSAVPSDDLVVECLSVVFGPVNHKLLDALCKDFFGEDQLLSSGQMQLILIGRALIDCILRGSSLLVMDEASCSLSLEDDIALHSRLLLFLKSYSIALLTVTHRPEVSCLFERKLCIKRGHLSLAS